MVGTHKSLVDHVHVMKFKIITSNEAHQIRFILHYESSFYMSLICRSINPFT